ncbi:hypothetical protein [Kribbella sancticallisti]|uniref:hypothetical protein n=1 Tax=Kribbella sancticallisti TaxID=460087 RepID=UPI0031DAD293
MATLVGTMDGLGGMRRRLVQGLALLAAVVAVCAFHGSASEPGDTLTAAAHAVVVPSADLVGPLHLDMNDVPSALPSAGHHAHLLVVGLLGASLTLLLALAVRAVRLVAYGIGDLWRGGIRLGAADPPWPTAPSLTQLCVLRT